MHHDAHCHLFNLKYPLYEIADMIEDGIQGHYPKALPDMDEAFPKPAYEGMRDMLEWLSQTAEASFQSEANNLKLLRKEYKALWNDHQPVAVVPLMMDVYYLFAKPVLQGEKVSPPSVQLDYRARPHAPVERFRAHIRAHFDANKTLDVFLKVLKPSVAKAWIEKILRWITPAPDYFDSAGFRHHRLELQALVKKNPGTVFPFFAVDPRRPGVIDAILKGGIVSKKGPFFGIKLYPRLGVHPDNPELRRIYSWCQENDIPIITHCDSIGFPPPPLEKILKMDYGDLGDPKNYRQILHDFPNLKIDFAHFGMTDAQWSDSILELMALYPNVYTDLACYAVPQVVDRFVKQYKNDPRIQGRVLMGSDFDVMYFVAPGVTLGEYYENFKKSFSQQELEQMCDLAPRNFLGI